MKPHATIPDASAIWARPVKTFELDADRIICLELKSHRSHILYRHEHAILLALQRPCPIRQVTKRLEDIGWSDTAIDDSPEVIKSLIKRGLVTTLGTLLAEIPSEPASAALTIDCISWPTRNRPECLARALHAWIDLIAQGQLGQPELVIADDSDPGSHYEAQTQGIVAQIATVYPGKVRYLGWQYRRELAQALDSPNQASPDTNSMSAAFALGLSPTGFANEGRYGAVRNLILLACAGKVILMSDDDTVPRFKVHPASQPGIELAPTETTGIIQAFARPQELEIYGRPASLPELSQAYALLGLSSVQAMESASIINLESCESQALHRYTASPMHIAGLVFGAWGDSGMGQPNYLLAPQSDTHSPPLAPGDYQAAKQSRLIFRTRTRHSLGQKSMMAMHLALDTRSPLPPFSPLGRNEDGLWSRMLDILNPGQYLAHPAIAIKHEPPIIRPGEFHGPSLGHQGLNDMLLSIIAQFSPLTGTHSYHYIGQWLCDLARPDTAQALGETLEQAELDSQSAHLAMLLRRRSEQDKPRSESQFIQDLDDLIKTKIQALSAENPPTPFHLQATALLQFREYLAAFGMLIQKWPSLYGKAMEYSLTSD